MSYFIFRMNKMKNGTSSPIEAHHERLKNKYDSNPDIIPERTHNNFHIVKPADRYSREINKRIKDAGATVRKNSTRYVDVFVSASPDFFEGRDSSELEIFFTKAVDFMAEQVGRQNIFSAVVHMDEKTPHMHLCFTPLTEDGRLSAKDVLGNAKKLSKWQDDAHGALAAEFPELERGQSSRNTGRKHIPVWLFKLSTSLNSEMQAIDNAISNMRTGRLDEDKVAVQDMLATWLPKVSGFNMQLKKLAANNEEMKDAMAEAQADKNIALEKYNFSTRKYLELQGEFGALQDFVNSIPQDLQAELFTNYKNLKQQHDDRDW